MQNSQETSFSEIYSRLFSNDTIRILYLALDPGVDDSAALLQFLARQASQQSNQIQIEILAIIPSVGNAIRPQTELNSMRLLELADSTFIHVYPGARAPLAIQHNQTAIEQMEININATHFYGHDGEADVGNWPVVTMTMQDMPGYRYAANLISNATPDSPITLVTTSCLTELDKTLDELRVIAANNSVPFSSYTRNINAISMMGGIINPENGANAPFGWPDNKKISEANFYFDVLAAKNVMETCSTYNIPILLAPLDLTQQKGLLWTKRQVGFLDKINNPVAKQMARVSDEVPYIDALHFPLCTYPMHDLQAATSLLFPQFYDATPMAIGIGDEGQIIVKNSTDQASKNVYVLDMPLAKQSDFYDTVLAEYNNFKRITKHEVKSNTDSSSTFNKALLSFASISLALGGASMSAKSLPDPCKPKENNHLSPLEIIGIVGSAAVVLGLGALAFFGYRRSKQKVSEKALLINEENTPLLQNTQSRSTKF